MADVPEIHELDTAERRSRQVEHELRLIAEGSAAIERGEYHELDVVEVWLDALEHDPNAKLPPFGPRNRQVRARWRRRVDGDQDPPTSPA